MADMTHCANCGGEVPVEKPHQIGDCHGPELSLPDFLLARIQEDEAVARAAIDPDRPGAHWQWVRTFDDVPVDDPASDPTDEFTYGLRTVEEFPTTSGVGDLPAFVTTGLFPSESLGHRHIARHDPARVLAECEAKRQIVEMAWVHLGDDDYAWGMEEAKRQILAVLALPYADHPDYREEWKS